MKIGNAKFAFVFAEKTAASAFQDAPPNSKWSRFLSNAAIEMKKCEGAAYIPEGAWQIDLHCGAQFLGAIIHDANTKTIPLRILFSKREIEWILSRAPKAQPQAQTLAQGQILDSSPSGTAAI